MKRIISELRFILFLSVVDGCLKTTVQQPQPPATAQPLVDPSTVPASHRLPCTPQEIQKTRCINDGQCFVAQVSDTIRVPHCSCTSEWMGNRCEQRYVDPSYWAVLNPPLEQTNVGGIVGIVLGASAFIVIVIILIWFFYCRKYRKMNSVLIPDSNAKKTTGSKKINGVVMRHSTEDEVDCGVNTNYAMSLSPSNNSTFAAKGIVSETMAHPDSNYSTLDGKGIVCKNMSPPHSNFSTGCSTLCSTYSISQPLTVHETSI